MEKTKTKTEKVYETIFYILKEAEISFPECVGILELLKQEIYEMAFKEEDKDEKLGDNEFQRKAGRN